MQLAIQTNPDGMKGLNSCFNLHQINLGSKMLHNGYSILPYSSIKKLNFGLC